MKNIHICYKMDKDKKMKVKSAYQELNQILNDFKEGKITTKNVLDKIELKENPIRPYGKVSDDGKISLFEIIDEPITLDIEDWKKITQIMKEEKWDRFSQTIKNGYIDKYIFYNEQRATIKKKQFNQYKKEEKINKFDMLKENLFTTSSE